MPPLRAEQWEPDELRGSRPVLRAAGGETPLADSPTLSCIKKAMQKNNLFGRYTLQGLLDQLDVIECFGRPGKDLRVGEITKKQQELYTTLGVDPPSSL